MNTENFCGYCFHSPRICGRCTGMGIKTCPNRPLVSKLYNEGKLTENTNLSKNPPGWTSQIDQIMNYQNCKREWSSS